MSTENAGKSPPVAAASPAAEQATKKRRGPRKKPTRAKGRKLGKPRGPTLTKAIREALVENVRAGVNVTRACEACKVPRSNWYYWKKFGEAGRQPYKGFLVEIAQARAEFETENLKIIANCAANGDSRSAQWLLEHHPHIRKRWGVKQRVEHTGKDGGPIQSATVPLDAIADARKASEANVAAAAQRREAAHVAALEAEVARLRDLLGAHSDHQASDASAEKT